ncbi:BamA/TamA family outer membrane protein [Ramlibacter sp. PS3R-8]|uniref:BamA/TamA family outer membrane protein n=1 Tax=Ramlibacter sp. PS3R-8 TaxID=3133437 RepID=UPI003098DBA0
MKRAPSRLLCCALLSGALLGAEAMAADEPVVTPKPEKPSRIRSPDDGQLDISGFLDEAYGFVPLVVPITEPAVGIGGAAALIFIDKQKNADAGAGFGRPNLSIVGALGTDNGTQGAFAGDIRHWLDDRVKTMVGVMRASVNLDFYGSGRIPSLQDNPRAYNLDTEAGLVRGQFRIGQSPVWLGLGYVLATTKTRFDIAPDIPGLPDLQGESRVGGVLPSVTFDSRDNVFTPTAGNYAEVTAGLFDKSLGSDTDFQRVSLTGIHYQPLARHLSLGVLANSVLSYGDVPFYLRPFINMRGVQAMRYQGDKMAQVEAEVRWQFHGRYSVVGFGGFGATRTDGPNGRSSRNVGAVGAGFRYEIARKYGLHMGIDVARGPDGTAWYVQFGSAWARP